ncbi:MAG: hypothetical protein M0Z38_05605 [Deltaproteobacteria bacterium]|nr:hypothetical protein [Deltaproteobacteria bacterium]
MKSNSDKVIGIAWYKKEQWFILRQVTENPNDIEDTYGEWLENAIKLKKKLMDSGLTVEEVDIDIQDVISWCKKGNKTINSKNISEYVVFKLMEKNTK